ncbi:MAG: TPM domain-containing protein [Clostridia bacterium]|nr:TPM domain-containing protein [Clostridia bacterium]
MKKRISALLFMLIFCISLSIPAFAAETNYIIDETGTLTDDELAEANEYADYLADMVGIDFIYAYTYDEDIEAYAKQLSLGKRQDQVLMIENDDVWDVYLRGTPENIIDDEDMKALREAFDNEGNYDEAISAYMYAAAQLIQPDSTLSSGAESTIILDTRERVVDMAELLSDSDKTALLSKLDEISERQKLDIVVLTVNTLDGKTPRDYADDFYDYNGYGFGENKDGILLLVSMEDRDWWISTTGYGITALTDAGIEYISKKFLSDLSDGDYAQAFTTYAELCDQFITQAKTGEPYDIGNMPKEPFNIAWNILVAFVIGLVVAFVVTNIMKKQLKTVQLKSEANNYVKSNSMIVTENRDLFLYNQVSRRARPKETDNRSGSSGGSSTHTSSSGSSHGGGGGKF